MSAEIRDARTIGQQGGTLPGLNLDENLHSLLRVLLAQLRRARDTPLQFGIDGEEIVRAALLEFFAGADAGEWPQGQDWLRVTAALDKAVSQFLQPQCCSRREETHSHFGIGSAEFGTNQSRLTSAAMIESGNMPNVDKEPPHPLVVWLERFYSVMSGVQPRAIDIAGWRVAGFQGRDIAERLGLGLRLLTRVVEDMRVNWERALGKE